MAAAQRGDRRALDALLRRHYDLVHGVCRRVLGTARDADDAAQEAMISIVRGLPRFDGRSAVTTWIYRIATNAALDEGRRRARRPALRMIAGAAGTPPEPTDGAADQRLEAIADRQAIDEALAQLPTEFRVAVVLRDVADLDYAEIAAVLELPIGTVKSRIARGRGQLVQLLGNNPPEPQRQSPGS